jgi:hypothetical protein
MKTNSRDTGFPSFFTDAKSVESVRRQFIEAPLEAARQTMFGPALELAQLLRILPDAFVASEKRELERVKASAEKNDPRVAALEASIEQADILRLMARRGEVRAQRSLVAYATRNEVFHGFVSDSDLNPLQGLTVQVSASREQGAKGLSSTTDADGYFSIPIGRKTATPRGSEKEGENISPEKIADLLANKDKDTTTYEPTGQRKGVRVDILRKGKVIHQDPVPMGLGEGSVYREYAISNKEYSTQSDFQNFVNQPGEKPTSYTVDPKKSAASTSRSSTPAASERVTKKRATRGRKSTERKKKE